MRWGPKKPVESLEHRVMARHRSRVLRQKDLCVRSPALSPSGSRNSRIADTLATTAQIFPVYTRGNTRYEKWTASQRRPGQSREGGGSGFGNFSDVVEATILQPLCLPYCFNYFDFRETTNVNVDSFTSDCTFEAGAIWGHCVSGACIDTLKHWSYLDEIRSAVSGAQNTGVRPDPHCDVWTNGRSMCTPTAVSGVDRGRAPDGTVRHLRHLWLLTMKR